MKTSFLLVAALLALTLCHDGHTAVYKRRIKFGKSVGRGSLLRSQSPSPASSASRSWTPANRWPRPSANAPALDPAPEDTAPSGSATQGSRWRLLSVVPSLPRRKKYWLKKASTLLQSDGNDDKTNKVRKGKRLPSRQGSDSDSGRRPQAKKSRDRARTPESSDWEDEPTGDHFKRRVLKKKTDKSNPAVAEDSSSDSEPQRTSQRTQQGASTSAAANVKYLGRSWSFGVSPTAKSIVAKDRAHEPTVYLQSHKTGEDEVKLQKGLVGTDKQGNLVPIPFYQVRIKFIR